MGPKAIIRSYWGSLQRKVGIWGKRVRTLYFECSLKPEHSVLSASQCSKISVHSVLSALRFLCFTVHWRVHAALCVVWAMRLHVRVRRTQWHALSAANVQVSASNARAAPSTHRLVHLGRASVTPLARQPCSVVSGEPVGRTGDEPDEGRVGHDG